VRHLTAAFTGLRRGELLAPRWRDVDFTASTLRVADSFAVGALTTPKNGWPRAVPARRRGRGGARAAREAGVAHRRRRPRLPGELGGYLDGSALRRRYDKARDRAGLRPLRFHDLRHTVQRFMPAEQMDGWVTDLRANVIDGAGHWVQQERPTEVSEALLGFSGRSATERPQRRHRGLDGAQSE
jgi:integrase